MRLADCVAQCRTPFTVHAASGRIWTLNNTADFARAVAACPVRHVLSDDLTRLCADLAYSKGARTLECSDLLHIPATSFWLEWCNAPWRDALRRYGFPLADGCQWVGHRGALVHASHDGRRGWVRTFWTGPTERDVLASSAEAYFDFDTLPGEEPEVPERQRGLPTITVFDAAQSGDDVLARCFRFCYERSWSAYYEQAGLSETQRALLWRHTLGTIAMDIPLLLAFVLLLSTRTGLPQQRPDLERLNRSRLRSGKPALLDHIEVRAPLLPEYRDPGAACIGGGRRGPRLHYVRGHLVRRGTCLYWRVPHLRGSARAGAIQSRTVVWTFEDAPRRADA
jgi:hypothetical protein